MPEAGELPTVAEVAECWQVSARTIQRYNSQLGSETGPLTMKSDKIPAWRVTQRHAKSGHIATGAI
jgi:hypothetical protein